MSDFNGPAPSLLATSGTTTYPVNQPSDGTVTQASSDFATARIKSIESIIIEDPGSLDGILTIKDHAGTRTVATIPLADQIDKHYGVYGRELNIVGLSAVLTGTGMKVRLLFRPA
jgi:hypothetical protein